MKCPMCGGIGLTDLHTPNVGRCIKCNGSGEIEPTNEEWLRSLNTEPLAEWIAHQTLIALLENQNNHSLRMTYPAYWVEWLKQPHND